MLRNVMQLRTLKCIVFKSDEVCNSVKSSSFSASLLVFYKNIEEEKNSCISYFQRCQYVIYKRWEIWCHSMAKMSQCSFWIIFLLCRYSIIWTCQTKKNILGNIAFLVNFITVFCEWNNVKLNNILVSFSAKTVTTWSLFC